MLPRQSVQIVGQPDGAGQFKVGMHELETILNNPKYADKKICIISIAGQFRQGKSFLLNFLLTFLRHGSDWRQHFDQMNGGGGFKWCSGPDRDTVGIHLWPEGFELPGHEDKAIFLMDTQGLFDNKTNSQGNTTIFTLSALLSSIQIINVPGGKFGRELLQMLDFFTSFACFAAKMDENEKNQQNEKQPAILQTLLFLIRDWVNEHEFQLGHEGGKQYLHKEIKNRQKSKLSELRDVGNQIFGGFDKVDCFLLPKPGKIVQSDKFTGKLEEVDPKFCKFVDQLIGLLFSKEFLVPKKVGNVELKCRDVLFYFETYARIMQSNKLPEPMSLIKASAEASHMAAFANAVDHYEEKMKEKCAGNDPLSPAMLDSIHRKLHLEAADLYKRAKKLGNLDKNAELKAISGLEEELQMHFVVYKECNAGKILSKQLKQKIEEAKREMELAKRKLANEQRRLREEESAYEEACKQLELQRNVRKRQENDLFEDLERRRAQLEEAKRKREETFKLVKAQYEQECEALTRQMKEMEEERERIDNERAERMNGLRGRWRNRIQPAIHAFFNGMLNFLRENFNL